MNKRRRTAIEKLICELEAWRDQIGEVAEEEQNAFDNLPESLQGSEQGELMEDNAYALQEAYDNIDNVIMDLNNMLENNY